MTNTPTPASEIEARLRDAAVLPGVPSDGVLMLEAADHIAALEARLREETEACAKVADSFASAVDEGEYWLAGRIASRIRARSLLPTETK